MKESKNLRTAMAWIHTWLGLLAGWILFAMFLTGAASYFRPEITRWMQPELNLESVAPARAAETAVAYLQTALPDDRQWTIYLPDQRTTATRLFSQARPNIDPNLPRPARKEMRINPATGQPLEARDTRGGEHFYRFHFQLQIPHPWGRWLAGLCAMFMLTAIISGVIAHKRIFTDFFTLRWGRGQRSWLDAHNASAVLALPFHAMITYTGLITLVAMYMPWPVTANYKTPAAFNAEAFGTEPDQKPSGRNAPLTAVGPLVEDAMRRWNNAEGNHGTARAARVVVRNPNDESALVTVIRHGGDTINARGQSITYSGVTGERISSSPQPGPAVETAGVMLGLHMGWFADIAQRWIYFALSLMGTAMVGTGLIMWTAKRAKPGTTPFSGFRLVDRMNIASVACLPAGMAAFFIANRVIPAGLPGRAAMEVSAMYWVWFGLAAISLIRPARRAWVETLTCSAVAFAAIPFVSTVTTGRGLMNALASSDTLFAAFDAVFFASAAVLGFAAWKAAQSLEPERATAPQLKDVADAA